MRPKFHIDTMYFPVDGGVYLRNNQATLTIKGKTLYRWLEKLTPYLDGQHTLEEITASLDESRKSLVIELVETLCEHHFLTDVEQDQPHALNQEELGIYASEIAFLETFQPSAARRFEQFRHTRVLIIGAGISNSALIRSCLDSGVRSVSVIRTTEEEPVEGIFSAIDETRLFHPHDSAQQVEELKAPYWDDETAIRQVIRLFDAILHISDHPMLARARILNALCVEQKKILLQACFVGDYAWVGPLVSPEVNGCWECAWRRLQATVQAEERHLYAMLQDQGAHVPNHWFAFPAAAMAANHLVFELFQTITRMNSAEPTNTIVSIDLKTLTSRTHSFVPHPHCQTCQQPAIPTEAAFLSQIERLQKHVPLDPTTFSKQAARCFDIKTGLFTAMDEYNYEQLPLAVCKVTVSDPAQLNQREVFGVGSTFRLARWSATQRACEAYASSIVDTRLLVTEKMAAVYQPKRVLSPSTDTLDTKVWCYALNLASQQSCLVPAQLVFPALRSEAPAKIGIGSGQCWPEAVCRALLDWASYVTVAQVRDSQSPYRKFDLSSIPLNKEGRNFFHLLAAVGALPDIYDITGSLGIPTCAICSGTQTLAYRSHCDVTELLVEGLELALQHYQANSTRQSEYALEPVAPLPAALRSDQSIGSIPLALPQEWPDRQIWLVQKFQEHGWQMAVTPLNHDAALADVLPFLVRVLIVQDQRKIERSYDGI